MCSFCAPLLSIISFSKFSPRHTSAYIFTQNIPTPSSSGFQCREATVPAYQPSGVPWCFDSLASVLKWVRKMLLISSLLGFSKRLAKWDAICPRGSQNSWAQLTAWIRYHLEGSFLICENLNSATNGSSAREGEITTSLLQGKTAFTDFLTML